MALTEYCFQTTHLTMSKTDSGFRESEFSTAEVKESNSGNAAILLSWESDNLFHKRFVHDVVFEKLQVLVADTFGSQKAPSFCDKLMHTNFFAFSVGAGASKNLNHLRQTLCRIPKHQPLRCDNKKWVKSVNFSANSKIKRNIFLHLPNNSTLVHSFRTKFSLRLCNVLATKIPYKTITVATRMEWNLKIHL